MSDPKPITARGWLDGWTLYVTGGTYVGVGWRKNDVCAVLDLGWLTVGLVKWNVGRCIQVVHHLMQAAEEDGTELVLEVSGADER